MLTAWLDRALYPEHSDRWDEKLLRERVLAALPRNARILDLGAGAGVVPELNFRGLAATVCGLDLDPRVTSNPNLDHAHIADATDIPYPAETFDVVFSDNVLEHLPDPASVFAEVSRVLKPGGAFIFKTPNRWHYMPLIARLTPMWFHHAYKRLMGRACADTFPTLYRANGRTTVTRLAKACGLTIARLERIEGRPEYLRLSPLTYLLGWLYERAVNATPRLARFRVLLVGELRKA